MYDLVFVTFPGPGDRVPSDLLPVVGVDGLERILDNEDDLDFGLGIDIFNALRLSPSLQLKSYRTS